MGSTRKKERGGGQYKTNAEQSYSRLRVKRRAKRSLAGVVVESIHTTWQRDEFPSEPHDLGYRQGQHRLPVIRDVVEGHHHTQWPGVRHTAANPNTQATIGTAVG